MLSGNRRHRNHLPMQPNGPPDTYPEEIPRAIARRRLHIATTRPSWTVVLDSDTRRRWAQWNGITENHIYPRLAARSELQPGNVLSAASRAQPRRRLMVIAGHGESCSNAEADIIALLSADIPVVDSVRLLSFLQEPSAPKEW